MEMPACGDAAFRATIRFASAPTIRCCAAVGGSAALRMRHTPCGCRSAYLVEVQTNLLLPTMHTVSIMRTAASAAMPLFRKQSAAEQTSLAPHDSKARLLSGRDSQGFMAKPCTPHPIAQRVQPFKLQTANAGGRGALPSPFSGGFKGGILFGKRISPLVSRRARRSPSRAYAGKGATLSGYPSLRAARGKHLRPCGRKKRAPLRVLFFKSLRISRTGTSGRLRR